MPSPNGKQYAPWYNVPEESIISAEHPCIVKNNMKAISMLGGPRAIAQNLELGTERTLALSFKPEDPASRTVLSLHHQTNNVLLKITVPKRTGRKRKRGSTDPYMEDVGAETQRGQGSAAQLLTSMSDNAQSYTIEPVGNITSTHVWRSMPDFVFTTKGMTFMRDVERKLLSNDYLQVKDFTLNPAYGGNDSEAAPPPVLSTQSMPYPYFYRQNQAIFKLPETNTSSNVHKLGAAKTYTHAWQYDSPDVPSGPVEDCPPLSKQPPQVQAIVKMMQPLFEERPLWTRRALLNQLPDSAALFFAKHAIAYVAFVVRSGPYRDTLCRFGVDPRTDRKYRKYQTILLQIPNAPKGAADPTDAEGRPQGRHWVRQRDPKSHIFNGRDPVPADGKVWQLCDIEDKQLKDMVDIEDLFLRSECEIRYFGWYPNGVYAKLKILLKAKVDRLIAGRSNEPSVFDRLVALPDKVDAVESLNFKTGSTAQGYVPKEASREEFEWASAYRSVIKTPVGSLPAYGAMGKGRVSRPKPSTRPSFLPRDDDDNDDENGEAEDIVEDEEDEEAVIAARFAEPDPDEDEDEDDEDNDEDNDDDNE